MKNKSLIIFIAALIGFTLPIYAEDFFSDMHDIILEGMQKSIKEDCKKDYVVCANSVSEENKKELIAELQNLDEEKQTELMISAVKRDKRRAIEIFLEAGILPDYNAISFAKDKAIKIFKTEIDTQDKCSILSSAISDKASDKDINKVLLIFSENEFVPQCSVAGLADNFDEANANALLNYVNGNADKLHAYITLNGKDRFVTLLAYCIVNEVQETSPNDNEKVINFLLDHNANMQQEIYPGTGLSLQELKDQYEEAGGPLTFY